MRTLQAFAVNPDTNVIGVFDSSQVSATAPVSSAEGDFWLDSSSSELFIYYDSSWIGIK